MKNCWRSRGGRILAVAAALVVPALASTALAQERVRAVVNLGAGVEVKPAFPGSDEYELGPDASISFDSLRLPFGLEFGSPGDFGVTPGFGISGSFRYLSERDSSDYSELEGLDDVDRALEIGLGINYEQPSYRLYADLRRAVIGHDGWVAELGADAILHPTDALTLNLGPRFSFGDDKFVDTYFGVGEDEAAGSALSAFDPGSGPVSVGMEIGGRYAFSEHWGLEGAAGYDRLVGDAADSPIVETGSEDQYSVRLGITRRITLGF
jgi:MipA family protein